MRIKVYGDEEKSEETAILRLLEVENGVGLFIVYENGNIIPNGRIATIKKDGVLHLHRGLSSNSSLQKDSKGFIQTNLTWGH